MKKLITIFIGLSLLLLNGISYADWVDCSGFPSAHTVTVNINLASDGSSIVAAGATTERAGAADSNYYYNFTGETAGLTYMIECIDATDATNDFSFTLSGRETFVNASVKSITDKLPTNYIMGSTVQTAKDDEIDAILTDTGTTIPGTIATAQADLDNPTQYMANVSALASQASVDAIPTNPTLQTTWTDEKAGFIDYALTDVQSDIGAVASSLSALSTDVDSLAARSYDTMNIGQSLYKLGESFSRQLFLTQDSGSAFTGVVITYGTVALRANGTVIQLDTTPGVDWTCVEESPTYMKPANTGAYLFTLTVAGRAKIPATADQLMLVSFTFEDSGFPALLTANESFSVYVTDSYVGDLALDSTVAKEATLANATYGLSALQVLLDAIATSTELTAMFDAIKGVGWTTETLVAIQAAIESGGLSAQEVRDAMKLTPTAGSPAAGSVDKHLDDIDKTIKHQ